LHYLNTCIAVAVIEATAGTEDETLTMVPHQMMCGAVEVEVEVEVVGMPWRMIAAMTDVGEAAGGGDLVVAVRNAPAMTAVGVG